MARRKTGRRQKEETAARRRRSCERSGETPPLGPSAACAPAPAAPAPCAASASEAAGGGIRRDDHDSGSGGRAPRAARGWIQRAGRPGRPSPPHHPGSGGAVVAELEALRKSMASAADRLTSPRLITTSMTPFHPAGTNYQLAHSERWGSHRGGGRGDVPAQQHRGEGSRTAAATLPPERPGPAIIFRRPNTNNNLRTPGGTACHDRECHAAAASGGGKR